MYSVIFQTKLNEDTTPDIVSGLNEVSQFLPFQTAFSEVNLTISQSASFNYGLRNYEEGIIIDSELALQETDEELVPASERLFDEDTWKKWKLKSGAVVADLLDKFARKKGHPLKQIMDY